MGYDWSIILSLRLDPATGKAAFYNLQSSRVELTPFNPADFVVPEEYREFIQMRGHHLQVYTKPVEEDSKEYGVTRYDAVPSEILHFYPSWESILEKDPYIDWTEEEHTKLKEALKWFDSKGCYKVEWCY